MLHGSDRDPRTTTDAALSQPAGASDGTNEDQDQHAADGSRGELQQAETPQGRLLSGTVGQQPGYQRKPALVARSVPRDGGAAKQNGNCSDPLPTGRSIARGTCRAPDE